MKKPRHTAKRIFEPLRDEHGFTGGITLVTDHVREKKRRSREVFVPLSHPPGHAQVDVGGAVGVTGNLACKLHCFAMVDIESAIGPGDTVDAALGRLLHQGLSGRDDRGLLRRAVRHDAAIGPRRMADGNVEGVIGYGRRNFRVPAPRFGSFDDLNDGLEDQCLKRLDDIVHGRSEPISERLMRNPDALLELPNAFAALHRLLETVEMTHVNGAVRRALYLGAIG